MSIKAAAAKLNYFDNLPDEITASILTYCNPKTTSPVSRRFADVNENYVLQDTAYELDQKAFFQNFHSPNSQKVENIYQRLQKELNQFLSTEREKQQIKTKLEQIKNDSLKSQIIWMNKFLNDLNLVHFIKRAHPFQANLYRDDLILYAQNIRQKLKNDPSFSSSLTEIHFGFEASLTRLPKEIGFYKNLNRLSLDDQLAGFSFKNLEKLQSLTRLSLSNSRLESIPQEVLSLKNLTALTIDYNRLTKLPGELKNLSQLQNLSLKFNKLTWQTKNSINRLMERTLTRIELKGNFLNDLVTGVFLKNPVIMGNILGAAFIIGLIAFEIFNFGISGLIIDSACLLFYVIVSLAFYSQPEDSYKKIIAKLLMGLALTAILWKGIDYLAVHNAFEKAANILTKTYQQTFQVWPSIANKTVFNSEQIAYLYGGIIIDQLIYGVINLIVLGAKIGPLARDLFNTYIGIPMYNFVHHNFQE